MKKLSLLSILLLSACGTVFSGTTQDISIDANIPDVAVYVDGAKVCTTPCIYPLERMSGSVAVMGKKAGYEDVVIPLKTKLNPVAIGNLTFIYSWTTDVVSGGAWKYNHDGIYLNMEKKNMTRAENVIFENESKIRHFTLHNFNDLRLEANKKNIGEYTTALSELSGIEGDKIKDIIKTSAKEVVAADNIVSYYKK